MRVSTYLLLLACVLVSVSACRTHAPASASPSPTLSDASLREIKVGLGVACSANGITGPTSYRVRDIGQPGVPAVSAANVAMVRAITRYVHPSTLMFAYVPGIVPFVVYDASNGVCSGGQYFVLNARPCNLFYVPADIRFGAIAAPSCISAPRPWIANDSGNKTAPSWQSYPNTY